VGTPRPPKLRFAGVPNSTFIRSIGVAVFRRPNPLLRRTDATFSISEIADLRASDLQLTKPFQVRLFGKGRKERYCPLWPQTAAVLRAFSKEQNLDLRSADHTFLNHRGRPLTRFGIRCILAKCLDRTSQKVPNLRKKRLHPHSMRHSTAVALLKSAWICRRSATISDMPAWPRRIGTRKWIWR
jgi:integrase